MKWDNIKIAGTLLFVGSIQFLLCMIIAETLYPNYSASDNYISDLGVGTTSLIFNSSVFLLGVTALVSAYLIQRVFNSKIVPVLMILTGIGAMGVGLFPETFPEIHSIASLITFTFGGLAAIMSYKLEKPPLSYFSILLGVFSLVALALFITGNHLGLGKGGMERMIAYPTLLWAVRFSGYLGSYSNMQSEHKA